MWRQRDIYIYNQPTPDEVLIQDREDGGGSHDFMKGRQVSISSTRAWAGIRSCIYNIWGH